MKKNWLERTELLIKENNLEKLRNARVMVIGLGGVGSFAAEFLARSGVGSMTIVDGDVVDETNINRQLPALHSTIGQSKVELMAQRLLDINPHLLLTKRNEFLNLENMVEILDSQPFDYVLDCIDSVTPKITLIKTARRKKIKIVSCMGAGGKLDPAKVEVYPYLAESYSQDGAPRKAIETLNKLENIVGLNEKISLQKFQLYSQINEKTKAYEESNKYIEKYPTEPKYLILLGDLYMRDNLQKDAWTAYSKAALIDPDNPYLINSLSNYYEATGQREKSEKILSDAILNKKIDVDAKLGIMAQYVNMLQQSKKDLVPVNAYFDSLMTQYPQEPKLNLMYGNLLMLQGKKQSAHFQYQVFAESNPTNPTGWEQLLRTTFPDSLDASIKICQTAISYVPQQPQFYFYLGICQYQKADYKNALKTYQTGLKYVDPENGQMLSDFYGQIGDLFNRIGQKDSSFASYEKSLMFNPQNLGVLNNYSYFLSLDKKDLDKAEKMSSSTVKAEPTNPTYLDTYGWVLYVQEAFTMAKIYLEKAVNYSGDKPSAEVLEHYGDVLYKIDEKEKALEYWKRALEQTTEKNPALEQKVKTGKLN